MILSLNDKSSWEIKTLLGISSSSGGGHYGNNNLGRPIGCNGFLLSFTQVPQSQIVMYKGAGEKDAKISTSSSAPKSSAFTGKADFYEAFFFLQDVLRKAQTLGKPINSFSKIPWHPQDSMADKLGFLLTKLQYRQIRSTLNQLSSYSHFQEIRDFLEVFTPISLNQLSRMGKIAKSKTLSKLDSREPNLGHIDGLGRAVSVGGRKNSRAKIYLVPGTGECWVNGRPAIEYFKRPHEMFKISDPLTVTSSFGKYNAWCIAKGGGLAGQAGAIANGLAKAIALLNPGMIAPLRPYLRRDPRMVERKKPGQPKARKKFTWVKR